MLLGLSAHAQEDGTHQLAIPWGNRHLISPKLAGKHVMILLAAGMAAQVPTAHCMRRTCKTEHAQLQSDKRLSIWACWHLSMPQQEVPCSEPRAIATIAAWIAR